MATKNTQQPRRLFVFSYPGKPTATVNIIVDNLHKAQRGRANAQRSLLYQYKKAAKLNKDLPLKWDRLSIKPHAAR